MARTAVAAVAAAVLAAVAAHAQTQRPAAAPAPQDIMPALLEEVRGLRAALETMSSAGARVQLVLGRLQLQEQRLNTAIKRLDDTRTRLADLQRTQAEHQEQLASMDETKQGAGAGSVGGIGGIGAIFAHAACADRPTAEMIEEMKTHFKRQLERTNADVQRALAEEATLAGEVANEQARWSDMNQRLEELERSLTRR